jgi:hypothetical protein
MPLLSFASKLSAVSTILGLPLVLISLALFCPLPGANADIDLNTKSGSKVCVGKIC